MKLYVSQLLMTCVWICSLLFESPIDGKCVLLYLYISVVSIYCSVLIHGKNSFIPVSVTVYKNHHGLVGLACRLLTWYSTSAFFSPTSCSPCPGGGSRAAFAAQLTQIRSPLSISCLVSSPCVQPTVRDLQNQPSSWFSLFLLRLLGLRIYRPFCWED